MHPSISTKSAAEVLDVSTSTIRRLIDNGELKAHYVRHDMRVYVDSITAFQIRNEVRPKEEKKVSHRVKARSSTISELRQLGLY